MLINNKKIKINLKYSKLNNLLILNKNIIYNL